MEAGELEGKPAGYWGSGRRREALILRLPSFDDAPGRGLATHSPAISTHVDPVAGIRAAERKSWRLRGAECDRIMPIAQNLCSLAVNLRERSASPPHGTQDAR
ncbi:unnamed protein product [Pleuronectes platessa]|uniref:Uncharacterized protein n=1 Tax=Pleuronectes platessa TaxID=8262 RepID=A0A9N7UGV4_PLEPL|nr:unnamed protein product [Pleuronectes platessa]